MKHFDKILHALVGLVFGVLTYFSWAFALIAVLVFVLKEIFDMYKPRPTGFSLLDLLADMIGFFLGYTLITLIL